VLSRVGEAPEHRAVAVGRRLPVAPTAVAGGRGAQHRTARRARNPPGQVGLAAPRCLAPGLAGRRRPGVEPKLAAGSVLRVLSVGWGSGSATRALPPGGRDSVVPGGPDAGRAKPAVVRRAAGSDSGVRQQASWVGRRESRSHRGGRRVRGLGAPSRGPAARSAGHGRTARTVNGDRLALPVSGAAELAAAETVRLPAAPVTPRFERGELPAGPVTPLAGPVTRPVGPVTRPVGRVTRPVGRVTLPVCPVTLAARSQPVRASGWRVARALVVGRASLGWFTTDLSDVSDPTDLAGAHPGAVRRHGHDGHSPARAMADRPAAMANGSPGAAARMAHVTRRCPLR
jgi:hypothetical protein